MATPTPDQRRAAYAVSVNGGLSLRDSLKLLDLTVQDSEKTSSTATRASIRTLDGEEVFEGVVSGAWAWLRGEEPSA